MRYGWICTKCGHHGDGDGAVDHAHANGMATVEHARASECPYMMLSWLVTPDSTRRAQEMLKELNPDLYAAFMKTWEHNKPGLMDLAGR